MINRASGATSWTGRRIADIQGRFEGTFVAVRTSAPLDADALSRELVKALTELGVARPPARRESFVASFRYTATASRRCGPAVSAVVLAKRRPA